MNLTHACLLTCSVAFASTAAAANLRGADSPSARAGLTIASAPADAGRAALAPVSKITFKPFIEANPVDAALVPSHMCIALEYTLDSVGHKYDVILGSDPGGTDAKGVVRDALASHMAESTSPDTGISDGEILWADAGYAICTGTAPVVHGRRVRAASDGTQYAVELLPGGVERVYLLSMVTPHQLTVESVDDTPKKHLKVLSSTDVDSYVEVDAAGVMGATTPVSGAATEIQFFAVQMKLILGLPFGDPDRIMTAKTDQFKEQKTAFGRFCRLFPHQDIVFRPIDRSLKVNPPGKPDGAPPPHPPPGQPPGQPPAPPGQPPGQ